MEKGSRAAGKSGSSTPARAGPILIADLPTAWDEAHETFTSLQKCVYERKDLGLSRESDEMMVCDCVFDKRESIRGVVLARVSRGLRELCMLGAGTVAPGGSRNVMMRGGEGTPRRGAPRKKARIAPIEGEELGALTYRRLAR